MKLTSESQSFLNPVIQSSNGFVVINKEMISFYDYSKYHKSKIEIGETEKILLFFHKNSDAQIRTYSLYDDENSWMIVKGDVKHSLDECRAISKLMRMVEVKPDYQLISSIVGAKFDEAMENSSPSEAEAYVQTLETTEEYLKNIVQSIKTIPMTEIALSGKLNIGLPIISKCLKILDSKKLLKTRQKQDETLYSLNERAWEKHVETTMNLAGENFSKNLKELTKKKHSAQESELQEDKKKK